MAIPTTIQMVRDLLIGADSTVFDDDYITRQIDQGLVAVDIAIMIAESAASLVAGETDMRIGPLSDSASQEAKAWLSIKKNLIYRKETGAGLPNDGSASFAIGLGVGVNPGSSRQGMRARTDNPDRTENQFETGQFDNPPTNPSQRRSDRDGRCR